MASHIFLGGLHGQQEKMDSEDWIWVIERPLGDIDRQAAIAKGNIIEGIEAKE